MSTRSRNKRNSAQGGRNPENMSDVVDSSGDLHIFLGDQLREWTEGPKNIGNVLGMVTAIWPTSLAYQPPRSLISIYDLIGIMINRLNEGRKKGKAKADENYLEVMKEFCCLEDIMAITRAGYKGQNTNTIGPNLLEAIVTPDSNDEESREGEEQEDEKEDASDTDFREDGATDVNQASDAVTKDETKVAEPTPTKEAEAEHEKREKEKVVKLLAASHKTPLSKKVAFVLAYYAEYVAKGSIDKDCQDVIHAHLEAHYGNGRQKTATGRDSTKSVPYRQGILQNYWDRDPFSGKSLSSSEKSDPGTDWCDHAATLKIAWQNIENAMVTYLLQKETDAKREMITKAMSLRLRNAKPPRYLYNLRDLFFALKKGTTASIAEAVVDRYAKWEQITWEIRDLTESTMKTGLTNLMSRAEDVFHSMETDTNSKDAVSLFIGTFLSLVIKRLSKSQSQRGISFMKNAADWNPHELHSWEAFNDLRQAVQTEIYGNKDYQTPTLSKVMFLRGESDGSSRDVNKAANAAELRRFFDATRNSHPNASAEELIDVFTEQRGPFHHLNGKYPRFFPETFFKTTHQQWKSRKKKGTNKGRQGKAFHSGNSR